MSATADDAIDARKAAMKVLADAAGDEIARCLDTVELPAHADLREPENGLVMVRGRIGGDGAPFSFGEATVSARLCGTDGEVGSATLRRDLAKAGMIAVRAMLSRADMPMRSRPMCSTRCGRPCQRNRKSAEAAATRVILHNGAW